MKTKLLIFLLIIKISSFSLLADNAGDWLEIIPDARSFGLGGAQIASNSGAYAPFWNPAAIGKNEELVSSLATLPGDVCFQYFGYAGDFSFGQLGIAYINSHVDGFQTTSYVNATDVAHGYGQVTGKGFVFSNTAICLSIANKFANFRYGIGFKFLSQSLSNHQASGLAVDLGLSYFCNNKLQISAAFYNVILSSIEWDSGENYSLPLKGKLGLNYILKDNLTILFDIDLLGYQENDLYIGVEYLFAKLFSIRMGYNKNSFTIGAGVNFQKITFDFAYKQASTEYLDSSTRLSMKYMI